jgi:hypothetical protein
MRAIAEGMQNEQNKEIALRLAADYDRLAWHAERRARRSLAAQIPFSRSGQPATAADPLSPYDWQGRPDGIRLHRGCEADWFDSAGAPLVSTSSDDFPANGSCRQPAAAEARPATNGAGDRGALLDAGGKPTDDPEQGLDDEMIAERSTIAGTASEAAPESMPPPPEVPARGDQVMVAPALAANGEDTTQVETWAISNVDAARYSNWFQVVRREKGEPAAIRELREELDRVYVPPDKLQREVERIQRLAGH